jgi:aerobic carbon-monoxide dehydrogenase medium subunit
MTSVASGAQAITHTRPDRGKGTLNCLSSNPASRYAVVGVLVAQFDDGVRVGITGAGACAFRGTALEQALTERLEPDAIDAVEVPDAGFNSDMHASAEYRAHLVKVMARRAVEDLLAQ